MRRSSRTNSRMRSRRNRPTIAIVGLGYVGLTTAVAFASRGLKVAGYDVDAAKVDRINGGDPGFREPGVDSLLRGALKKGFSARTEVGPADFYFITVGTPSLQDGSIDLSYLKEASRTIGSAMRQRSGYQVVVVKSTVTPGTTETIVGPEIESNSGLQWGKGFGLAMNPEFLKEGAAVKDTLEPDRIVIGEADKRSGDLLWKLFKTFYGKRMPQTLRTMPVNAELIKYANNAFLAAKVSYINMVANLCEKLPGADVEVVAKGIGMDSRIGGAFLKAGPGWGGSCFPKDLKNFRATFSSQGLEAPMIDATVEVNENQPRMVIRAAEELLGGLEGKRVAVLGLAFKAETDDIRESVSVKIIEMLLNHGANVTTYDPAAMGNARKVLGDKVTFVPSAIDALKGADCCVVATDWAEFGKLRVKDFLSNMMHPAIVDTRRIYDRAGFGSTKYVAVGLGRPVKPRAKAPQLVG